MKKYGGVDNAIALDDIPEATTCEKPAVHYAWWQILIGFIGATIKLIPITVLIMIAGWGLSVIALWLCGA